MFSKFNLRFAQMKRTSRSSRSRGKNPPAENLLQSSRSRYLRAFAAARAIRFWRPRITGKELTVAAVFAAALAMGPSSAQAQFPASFDLSTLNGTNGFVITGIGQSFSGTSVSGAGDINGDGFDDVIIGAPFANNPNLDGFAGESYVVFGNDSGFSSSLDLSTLDGINGFEINGIDRDDMSGGSVSGAGDVNGDGFDDVIIGAQFAYPNEIVFAGESYVVFGNNSGFSTSLDLSTLDGTNGFVINGINSFDFSGRSVSHAGDVNGDGIDDVIIGADGANPNGLNSGESYVVFGSNNGFPSSLDLSSLNGINGFSIRGIDASDGSGGSVSGVGDVNGDGFDDIIIGAPLADPNGISAAGECYVVFGSNFGLSSIDLSTIDGRANVLVINGIDENERAGYSVSGAGDVNGDGIDDMIIGGTRFTDPNETNSGKSYVVLGNSNALPSSLDLSGLNGANGFVINGVDGDDVSGSSVSGAGDVNGDGIDDLIIGARLADPNGNSQSGESYVVFGHDSGFSSSLDLSTLDGTNGFVINGVSLNDESGGSVSGAGDVNGDGIDDLIIGAPFATDQNGVFVPGESYVVFGQAAVAEPLIGDVNQDGVIDFLDIAPFISLLSSNDFLDEADINRDEVVDFLDIAPFIDVLGSQ